MSGWIKLHRQLLNWEWYDNSNMVHLFIHMMLKANRESTTWKGILLQPGEFVSGRKMLSAETGISENVIRGCILKLQNSQQLTIRTTNKYTVFSLINWGMFQDDGEFLTNKSPANQPTNHQLANQQITNKSPQTINKEVKNREVIPPIIPQGGEPPRKKKETPTQMPDDFQPDAEYAKKYNMQDIDLAFEIFRDQCISRGYTYVDWNLAWKKACRDWIPEKYAKALANCGQQPQQSPEEAAAHAARMEMLQQYVNT